MGQEVGTGWLSDSSAAYSVYSGQLGLYSLSSWTGLQVTHMPDALGEMTILSLPLLYSHILPESRHKLS